MSPCDPGKALSLGSSSYDEDRSSHCILGHWKKKEEPERRAALRMLTHSTSFPGTLTCPLPACYKEVLQWPHPIIPVNAHKTHPYME